MTKQDVENALGGNESEEATLRKGLTAYDVKDWLDADAPGLNVDAKAIQTPGAPSQTAFYIRRALQANRAAILASAAAEVQADIDAAEALT